MSEEMIGSRWVGLIGKRGTRQRHVVPLMAVQLARASLSRSQVIMPRAGAALATTLGMNGDAGGDAVGFLLVIVVLLASNLGSVWWRLGLGRWWGGRRPARYG